MYNCFFFSYDVTVLLPFIKKKILSVDWFDAKNTKANVVSFKLAQNEATWVCVRAPNSRRGEHCRCARNLGAPFFKISNKMQNVFLPALILVGQNFELN
jgi:hypothetical protein